MNYPIWQLEFAGGGLLIALIATIHVFIAQFAVGGGLFLVLTEMKARRENSPAMLEYVKGHTRFFMLLTMVLGAMTGIGIWFTISLLNPQATSTLIHTFLFAWASEWLCFLVEILSLFIYAYTFDRLPPSTHVRIGWIYAGSAWLSLFLVSGIIDFMLTPGAWLQSKSFWDGFFNPTFWPALAFRTLLAIILAGLLGLLTASRLENTELRHTLIRYAAFWLTTPFILLLGASWWYKCALTPEVSAMIFERLPAMGPRITTLAISSMLLFLSGQLMAMRLSSCCTRSMAFVMLCLGFLTLASFEFIREGGRKPFIIRDYMFSSSILKSDQPDLVRDGVLKKARWVEQRKISDPTMAAAGRELFDILCLSCHSIGGPINDIRALTESMPAAKIGQIITSMGSVRPYMPPFPGSEQEKKALTQFLTTTLHKRKTGP